jgi:predicted AlkP superfamily phosphohydrolase/phosphomutase
VYQRLDAAVGELIARRHPETAVMILSDHGTGGAGDKVLHINRWLQQRGYLAFAGRNRWKRAAAAALRRVGLSWLPLRTQESIFRHGAGLAGVMLSENRLGTIDWDRTRAFSTEMNTLPGIWIHLQGRYPRGTVAPGPEYEQLRTALIKDLNGLTDPETGRQVVARAHRREDLYHGPRLEEAPDLLVELNLDRGYSYTCLPGQGSGPAIRRLSSSERLGAKGGSMNGSHRQEGIFLFAADDPAGSSAGSSAGRSFCHPAGAPVAGPSTSRSLEGLNIVDVAPTILNFYGLPVPEDMDGKIIHQVLPSRPREKHAAGERV